MVWYYIYFLEHFLKIDDHTYLMFFCFLLLFVIYQFSLIFFLHILYFHYFFLYIITFKLYHFSYFFLYSTSFYNLLIFFNIFHTHPLLSLLFSIYYHL